MKNLHCPAYVTALIHFHCYPEPIRDSPVNTEATKLFLREGLIELGREARYHTTPKGRAYVESLCSLPPPEAAFHDILGNTFSEDGWKIKTT